MLIKLIVALTLIAITMAASLTDALGPGNTFQVDKAYALNDQHPDSYTRLTLVNGNYSVDVVESTNEEVLGSFHVILSEDEISACHSQGFVYSSTVEGLDKRSCCRKRDINGKEVFDRRCVARVEARGNDLAGRQSRCGQFCGGIRHCDQQPECPRCTYTGGNCDYQKSCSRR